MLLGFLRYGPILQTRVETVAFVGTVSGLWWGYSEGPELKTDGLVVDAQLQSKEFKGIVQPKNFQHLLTTFMSFHTRVVMV